MLTICITKARVAIVDINASRLAYAKQLCPEVMTYQIHSTSPEECAAEIRLLFGENLPKVTLECTGIESSLRTAAFATGIRGVIMVIGVGKPDASIPVTQMLLHEVCTCALENRATFY